MLQSHEARQMLTLWSIDMAAVWLQHLCCFQVERPDQLKEIVPQKRLADKVSGILSRIEAELDAVDEKIGERMHILDLDNDGLVSLQTSTSPMCSSAHS